MPQPLVALQAALPQFADPADQQLKAYKLRDLAAQADVADQARADDQASRAAYAANPTDGAARLSALAGVSPKAYAAEAKAQADQAKASAETRAKQIDSAHKAIEVAGRAFDYVRRYPTPENAHSAIKWLTDLGNFTPEQAAQYHAQVDANPGGIQAMADQAFAAALDAKDHLPKIETRDLGGQVQTISTDPLTNKTTTLSTLAKTQSPDNVATNERIAKEGAANRTNQIEVQKMIGARQDAKGDAEASLDPDTLGMMAKQYLRGDKSVLQNLGRGAQGSANLVALRKSITAEAKAQGMSGDDIAARMADFQGQTAGLRTANNISARIENAAAEAAQLAPLAIEASRKVARSDFLPFGRAQVMFNNQTNDPDLNKFATANIGLATAYAGAMARGGKATVSDNEHARELLTTAKSQQAYEAIVNQMLQEIAAAQRAPKQVRDNLRGEVSGKGGHGAPDASAGKVVDFGSLK
ncbi:hypothetical protein ACL58G_07900 [Massilia sp. GER05]|uniref:hypothetical protein n=1 Tax=Massilia sp. GER05 TaxID=3394605 RepID=UPI003F874525